MLWQNCTAFWPMHLRGYFWIMDDSILEGISTLCVHNHPRKAKDWRCNLHAACMQFPFNLFSVFDAQTLSKTSGGGMDTYPSIPHVKSTIFGTSTFDVLLSSSDIVIFVKEHGRCTRDFLYSSRYSRMSELHSFVCFGFHAS